MWCLQRMIMIPSICECRSERTSNSLDVMSTDDRVLCETWGYFSSTLTDMGWLQVDHTEEGTADRLGVWQV